MDLKNIIPELLDDHTKIKTELKYFKNADYSMKDYEKKSIPASFYIHSWELTPELMPKIKIPFKNNFITYHNLDKVPNRMSELLKLFEFTSFH